LPKSLSASASTSSAGTRAPEVSVVMRPPKRWRPTEAKTNMSRPTVLRRVVAAGRRRKKVLATRPKACTLRSVRSRRKRRSESTARTAAPLSKPLGR
jgi:hypothetical protein